MVLSKRNEKWSQESQERRAVAVRGVGSKGAKGGAPDVELLADKSFGCCPGAHLLAKGRSHATYVGLGT